MIRRSNDEFIAECTECGTEFAGGVEDDFRAFVQALKDAGWQVRNNDGEWEHYCEDCKQ